MRSFHRLDAWGSWMNLDEFGESMIIYVNLPKRELWVKSLVLFTQFTDEFYPPDPKVDVFDTLTSEWSTLTSDMPNVTSDLSAFAHDGKIYVLGGRNFPAELFVIVCVYCCKQKLGL